MSGAGRGWGGHNGCIPGLLGQLGRSWSFRCKPRVETGLVARPVRGRWRFCVRGCRGEVKRSVTSVHPLHLSLQLIMCGQCGGCSDIGNGSNCEKVNKITGVSDVTATESVSNTCKGKSHKFWYCVLSRPSYEGGKYYPYIRYTRYSVVG